jgi:quercetin dioxygenase-like cupin family protein
MTYTHIEDLSGLLPETPPESIVSRTVYEGDDAKVILFAFAPGQALTEHTAARPAVLHFLSGEASVRARTEVTMLLVLLGEGA